MLLVEWPPILYTIFIALDILLVAGFIYYILHFFALKSIIRIFVVTFTLSSIYLLSNLFQLQLVLWLLEKLFIILPFAIIILFQQEVKQFIMLTFYPNFLARYLIKKQITDKHYYEIFSALLTLSETRTGAIIIFPRNTSLEFFKKNAVSINSDISAQLLTTIFTPPAPLHDGAVIIEDNKIVSAGVFVPITEKSTLLHLGSRHRAAIGISEHSDAVAITVSEETGATSLCVGGEIYYDISLDTIEEHLISIIGKKTEGV